jgi:PilZ domain
MQAAMFAPERRSRFRYPIEMNVRYRTLTDGLALVGTGRTLNVSSRGMLIASEQKIVHSGSRMLVSLDWPSSLDDATPLQLIAVCRVIRCQPAQFAVALEHYQFRTRKSVIPRIPPLPSPPFSDFA